MASSPSPLTGIEPTGNMVKKRAEFTVETRSAGQGEVLVYVEDPAGHQEEVGLHPGGAELRYAPFGGEGLLLKAHGLPPTTGKSDCQ
jgi:hypothetical protein